MKAVTGKRKIWERKQTQTHLIQFQLFIFYKPACLQKHFRERVLFIRVFLADGHSFNNRVFIIISRNYRLIVAPRKFDVLKTLICPRRFASWANMPVLRTSNYFYCSQPNFFLCANSKSVLNCFVKVVTGKCKIGKQKLIKPTKYNLYCLFSAKQEIDCNINTCKITYWSARQTKKCVISNIGQNLSCRFLFQFTMSVYSEPIYSFWKFEAGL